MRTEAGAGAAPAANPRSTAAVVGVDLAAQQDKTALARLEWSAAGATLVHLQVGVSDAALLEAVKGADKVGVDCPFGWPDDFVRFVTEHHGDSLHDPQSFAGKEQRRNLAWRLTDEAVRDRTKLIPLSVSADRIAHVAFRCALLLSQLAASGEPVDRAGSGTVVEVYPAGSLCCWGLQHRSYKGNDSLAALSDCVDALLEVTSPWLKLGAFEELCRKRDDAFDALIAALTARAAMLGLTTRPQDSELERARREGWIALPTRPLAELHEGAVQRD